MQPTHSGRGQHGHLTGGEENTTHVEAEMTTANQKKSKKKSV